MPHPSFRERSISCIVGALVIVSCPETFVYANEAIRIGEDCVLKLPTDLKSHGSLEEEGGLVIVEASQGLGPDTSGIRIDLLSARISNDIAGDIPSWARSRATKAIAIFLKDALVECKDAKNLRTTETTTRERLYEVQSACSIVWDCPKTSKVCRPPEQIRGPRTVLALDVSTTQERRALIFESSDFLKPLKEWKGLFMKVLNAIECKNRQPKAASTEQK